MTLSVDIRQRLGDFRLDAAFESSGRLTALLGASGSGKTSLVNVIGGLTRPADGRVAVEGRVLVDTATGVFVPAHMRKIGYVFQDARLFPHLTVRQNLTYGRFFNARNDRAADFSNVVEMLGIVHLLKRSPRALSGGERQRVAIGRALMASPRLLLMDEPLASLDDARKAEIMPYIERLRDEFGIPIFYVSHSMAEVSRLATDVVVLDAGRVRACGAASAILSRPDLVPADARGEAGVPIDLTVVAQDEAYGLSVLHSSAGEWRLPRLNVRESSVVRVRVRARDVMIARERPMEISALNVFPGVITEIAETPGADALVSLDCGNERLVARVTRLSVAALGLTTGQHVFAVIKAVSLDG